MISCARNFIRPGSLQIGPRRGGAALRAALSARIMTLRDYAAAPGAGRKGAALAELARDGQDSRVPGWSSARTCCSSTAHRNYVAPWAAGSSWSRASPIVRTYPHRSSPPSRTEDDAPTGRDRPGTPRARDPRREAQAQLNTVWVSPYAETRVVFQTSVSSTCAPAAILGTTSKFPPRCSTARPSQVQRTHSWWRDAASKRDRCSGDRGRHRSPEIELSRWGSRPFSAAAAHGGD